MNTTGEYFHFQSLLRPALRTPSLVVICIVISVGAIFSTICLVKYLRDSNLRTHYTYIFYFMLLYCLISSFVRAPMFLIGNYLNMFAISKSLCQAAVIHFLTINIGMVTSLAYASVERNFLILHKNGVLTWQRQLLPIIIILVYSYCVAILFTFIPSCGYTECIACVTTSLFGMLLWLIISFLIPQAVMIIATLYLLYRLYKQRALLHQNPQWSALKRIGIQMAVYSLWSCLCYCPLSFYSLSFSIDPSNLEPDTKIIIDIANIFVLQTYPILTFVSMLISLRRIRARTRAQSTLKLNNVTSTAIHSSEVVS